MSEETKALRPGVDELPCPLYYDCANPQCVERTTWGADCLFWYPGGERDGEELSRGFYCRGCLYERPHAASLADWIGALIPPERIQSGHVIGDES